MTEKESVLEQIKGYKFLAIDHKDEQIVVVMSECQNGYNGFALDQDNNGYDLSPMFIASSFIKNNEKRYDFTNDLQDAFEALTLFNTTD